MRGFPWPSTNDEDTPSNNGGRYNRGRNLPHKWSGRFNLLNVGGPLAALIECVSPLNDAGRPTDVGIWANLGPWDI